LRPQRWWSTDAELLMPAPNKVSFLFFFLGYKEKYKTADGLMPIVLVEYLGHMLLLVVFFR
jgi:hypothetical protein